MHTQVRINTPHIVHDTLEGETILINLKNGNYYSFDKTGAVIWEVIDRDGNSGLLAEVISEIFETTIENSSSLIDAFISQLLMENLVVEESQISYSQAAFSKEEMTSLVKERISGLEPPVLNKYSDMKDALMLDPIHDVDEKGWPTINEE